MGRIRKKRIHICLFHYPAAVHYRHLITDFCHHTQIVGDKQNGGSDLLFQVIHQIQDLGLYGHIQSCCRFIGNQNPGTAHKSHGDHNTLALTAGKLEGIFIHHPLHSGNTGLSEHVLRFLPGFFFGNLFMLQDTFRQLFADLHNRIQASHRLLKDHGDLSAPEAALLFFADMGNILSVQKDLAFRHLSGGSCKEAHNGKRGNALSASRLAYDAQGRAFFQAEVHTVHRFYHTVIHEKAGVQIYYF